jgi:glutathione S-transferase
LPDGQAGVSSKNEGSKRGRTTLEKYYPVAIVTLVAGIVIFGMAVTVSRAHAKTGILAPIMMGDPVLERAIRAHSNTLEWLPIFLASMWLFAIYWSAAWASALGTIWVIGRIIYFVGYLSDASRRFPGFFIQCLAHFALMLGALGRIIYLTL